MSETTDHQQEAERLVSETVVKQAKNGAMIMALFAEAQVHATLAQVDVLQEIADTLRGILCHGVAQDGAR